jgi:hypothetical protein
VAASSRLLPAIGERAAIAAPEQGSSICLVPLNSSRALCIKHDTMPSDYGIGIATLPNQRHKLGEPFATP